MTDFFNKSDEEETTEEVQEQTEQEEEKIKLGDEEYTQEDLQKYVGLGKIAEEAETRFNTKIDRVYPEFTRKSQRVKELEEELEQVKQTQQVAQVGDLTPEQIRDAQEAAKKLGILTKADLQAVLQENFIPLYQQQRAADDLLAETKRLEKEIDGKDGRPAFKQGDMLEYMRDTGISNPELAYKARYENQLDSWKEKQLLSGRKTGMTTLRSSTAGSKTARDVEITNENFEQILKETLNEPIR